MQDLREGDRCCRNGSHGTHEYVRPWNLMQHTPPFWRVGLLWLPAGRIVHGPPMPELKTITERFLGRRRHG
jgi:hypothetical protein